MPVDPLVKRALAGAILGAGVMSGAAKGAGRDMVAKILAPLTQHPKAIEFVARAMYRKESVQPTSWERMEAKDRALWKERAEAALEAMNALLAESVAGAPKGNRGASGR